MAIQPSTKLVPERRKLNGWDETKACIRERREEAGELAEWWSSSVRAMAAVRVGIDLGQKHMRASAFVGERCIIFTATEELKENASQPLSWSDISITFREAKNFVNTRISRDDFMDWVVVLPNSTSSENAQTIVTHALDSGYSVKQAIPEHTAVYRAYEEIAKPSETKRLAIISVTSQILDISILYGQTLEAEETHSQTIELEEGQPSHSKSSGAFGFVGGVVDSVLKTVLVDPLAKAIGIVENLLSSPKLSKSPVDAVVLVGKAAESEKLRAAVTQRFKGVPIFTHEGINSEDLAVRGAALIAFTREAARPHFNVSWN